MGILRDAIVFGTGAVVGVAVYHVYKTSGGVRKIYRKAATIWSTLDTNGDGIVDLEEFKLGMKIELGAQWACYEPQMQKMYDSMKECYDTVDADGDGQISTAELYNAVVKALKSGTSAVEKAVSKAVGGPPK